MFDSLLSLLRRNPRLYARLRAFKYTLWSKPGIGKLLADPSELVQMETIARQTSSNILASPGKGPKVLFFSMRGWSTHIAWETIIAAALRLRGAEASFYTCGKRLPLCDIASHHVSPPTPCDFCATYVNRALAAWGFSTQRLFDFTTPAEIANLRQQVAALPYEKYGEFMAEGLPVGKLITTSVRWFLCSGTIGDDKLARQSYHDFLLSAAIMARVGARLLDTIKPDKLFLLNGLFFAERIMMELARLRALPLVTYEVGFIPGTLVFAHERIAAYYEPDEFWPRYANIPLLPAEVDQLDEYLLLRKKGRGDAVRYFPSLEEDWQIIITQLSLERNKTLVTAFTNILWDSAILDRDRAFTNMIDWLDTTIQHFISRDDAQLVIRIHPAEIRLAMQETREQVAQVLSSRYPNLPAHIKIVPPESSLSSYILMRMSDVGLVYTSTVGLEMALDGKPVIVAGETHYAGKGFTYDVANRDEYLALLNDLTNLGALSATMVEQARRYAYLFFFRYMLPFPLTTTLARGRLRFNFDTLDDLRPGRWPELDLICEAILKDKPFIRETGVV